MDVLRLLGPHLYVIKFWTYDYSYAKKALKYIKKDISEEEQKKTWITKFASKGEIDNPVCLDSNPPTVNAMHFIFKNGFRM